MLHQFKSPPCNEMMTFYFQNFKFNYTSVIDYLDDFFYNFKSYPNTYYTKVRGTPKKIVTQKNGLFNVQQPHCCRYRCYNYYELGENNWFVAQ